MAALPHRVRRSAADALSGWRRVSPEIIETPEELATGEHLSLWLAAWTRWRDGHPTRVLYRPECEEWIREFPALQWLTAHREEIGFFQRRLSPADAYLSASVVTESIGPFIRDFLMQGSDLMERIKFLDEEALVIDVSFGENAHTGSRSLQTRKALKEYLTEALAQVPEVQGGSGGSRIVLVTEMPEWCRRNLGFLSEYGEVQAVPGYRDPFNRLAQLALGRNLILASTSFSYWGGYFASLGRPGHGPGTVVAPVSPERRFPSGQTQYHLEGWVLVPLEQDRTSRP